MTHESTYSPEQRKGVVRTTIILAAIVAANFLLAFAAKGIIAHALFKHLPGSDHTNKPGMGTLH